MRIVTPLAFVLAIAALPATAQAHQRQQLTLLSHRADPSGARRTEVALRRGERDLHLPPRRRHRGLRPAVGEHRYGKAVDFMPKPGQRAAVMAWLRSNANGAVITYASGHIHFDTGGYRNFAVSKAARRAYARAR